MVVLVLGYALLLPVSIVSEALFIYDMTSALADSKNFGGNLSAKTVLFVKKI